MNDFRLIVEYRDGPNYNDPLDQYSRLQMKFERDGAESHWNVVSMPRDAFIHVSMLEYILTKMIDALREELKKEAIDA